MNTRKRFNAQISVPVTQRMYDVLNERATLRQVTVAHITREILEHNLFPEHTAEVEKEIAKTSG